MAFSLADHWMWDHWIARRADQYHLFFLRASKALHNPDRRHWRASIGHAVSSDARNWTLLPDALVHSDGPAFDDQATWTGSAVVKDDGTIRLFYTGISRREGGMVQRVGWADSQDGVTFTRACAEPVEADGRWYEKWNPSYPWDEPWRAPYVFQHEGRWHMLVTARRAGVDRLHAGVIGHAVSDDLDHWEVLEPLTEPSQFGQRSVSHGSSTASTCWSSPAGVTCRPLRATERCGSPRGRGPWGRGMWTMPAMSSLRTCTPARSLTWQTGSGLSPALTTERTASSAE